MARKNNRKNTRGSARSKEENRWILRAVKILVVVLILVAAALAVCQRTLAAIKQAALFQVREIVTAPSLKGLESWHLNRLLGQSIFEVDLGAAQQNVQAEFPVIRNLRILRMFPDKIYVSAERRKPFALLRLNYRDVLLDERGVVLSNDEEQEEGLPVILGVSSTRMWLPGKQVNYKSVGLALNILKSFRQHDGLARIDVETIDVNHLSQINLRLSNGVSVFLDRDEVGNKVEKLASLLSQEDVNPETFEYVDMRFGEPVLGGRKR